ncbi:MAG: hypothetical protein K2N88_05835 [Muribaculaceae bacterium]|nr:hypothetical protein [Muribaculaceae bacterium]
MIRKKNIYKDPDDDPVRGTEQDSDALYSIENEDNEDSETDDDNGSPFDNSSNGEDDTEDYDEVEDEEDGEEEEPGELRPSCLGILFKTMFTPVEGWKALKRARFTSDEFASRCFMPMVGLAAISNAVKIFYEANYSFADWLIDALSTFLLFFFGYFSVILVGSWILPRLSRYFLKKEIGKEFVMLSLSTLALFWALIMVLPMLDPVLVFLPLWTIYLIFKGIRVIRVPADVLNSTTAIMIILINAMPLLWNWIINRFLFPFAGI